MNEVKNEATDILFLYRKLEAKPENEETIRNAVSQKVVSMLKQLARTDNNIRDADLCNFIERYG